MKTKDLIEELQKADPSGELDCCIGNADIHFVDVLPGYYDGCYHRFQRDENDRFVSAEYCSQTNKVSIRPISIYDAIFDNVNIPVTFDSDSAKRSYERHVKAMREESIEIKNSVERNLFAEYFIERATLYSEDIPAELVGKAAEKFYDENLSFDDKLPANKKKWSLSYASRRKEQWDKELNFVYEEGEVKIFRR